MNLPAFCIRRPAFTIVLSLVMIIIGLIGYRNLSIRWIPNVNLPQVTIITSYPGANAKIIEQDITKLIEKTLSGINGIETLKSSSKQGQSQISISFQLGTNINGAVEEVRSSLERVQGALPKDASNPLVMKSDPNNMPILFISFYNPRYNQEQLSDYVDQYLVPNFETLDGVANVVMYGKRVSAMQVRLDPLKLAASNITVEEVANLLHNQNASIPSGAIRTHDRYYSIVTNTSLKDPEQFNNLILRDEQNQIIRLKDVGEAKIDARNTDSAFRIKGKPAVALGILAQTTANPLEVELKVQNAFQALQKTLPAGMQANILYNQADYIRSSIYAVYESLIEAVFFVWIVILIFLCNFRATLIPILTIPVCLISTFALLYFLGFSINTITLMAFVLAIGLVVDDAIVMLENISRHIENGLSVQAAALKGSREIVFPIIAMTLTLAAVFTPIAFTPGLMGVLFREFTFTLAGAVVISGIVALTLSPMMCSRLLQSKSESNRYQKWFYSKFNKMQNKYAALLTYIIKKRQRVLLGLLFVIASGIMVYHYLPKELAPAEDRDEVNVFVSSPRSASFQYTDDYVKQLENIYNKLPEIDSYFSQVGAFAPNHSFQIIMLQPKSKRTKSTQAFVNELNKRLSALPGLRANVFIPPPPLIEFAGGDQGDRMGLVLMTNNDYRKLSGVSDLLINQIKKNSGFLHVDHSLKWDSEQFQINIDRDKVADLDLSIPDIANTLSTFFAGRNVGKVNDADIIVQLDDTSLADPNIFKMIYMRNLKGQMIPLSQVLKINEVSSPEMFKHFERLRSDTIYLSLSPNYKIKDAISDLKKIVKQYLPDDIKYTFTGEAKSFLDSNGKTLFTFMLALIFIYLVLVAQFESFIDPLIIMLTVPFAMVGALVTLRLFGGSLNIYSNIGLITLIGLIAKHGILITEFANRLRLNEGKSIQEAIVLSALLRLRPILMTTSAMVLGALPLALSTGPGCESRQQIGLVITGGLLFGTFFSLIVVPIAYTYLAPFRKLNELDALQTKQITA